MLSFFQFITSNFVGAITFRGSSAPRYPNYDTRDSRVKNLSAVSCSSQTFPRSSLFLCRAKLKFTCCKTAHYPTWRGLNFSAEEKPSSSVNGESFSSSTHKTIFGRANETRGNLTSVKEKLFLSLLPTDCFSNR
jgi:hypothetical protein